MDYLYKFHKALKISYDKLIKTNDFKAFKTHGINKEFIVENVDENAKDIFSNDNKFYYMAEYEEDFGRIIINNIGTKYNIMITKIGAEYAELKYDIVFDERIFE